VGWVVSFEGSDGRGWGWGRYGRKLQDVGGRWETRVKISEIRRCCTLVSWMMVKGQRWAVEVRMVVGGLWYQLGVELGQAGLA